MKMIRKEIIEYFVDEDNRMTKKVSVQTLSHRDKYTSYHSTIPLYEIAP